MFGKKKKRREKEALERAAQLGKTPVQEPPQPVGNGGPASDNGAAVAPRPNYDAKAAREMRRELQKALKRPVILPDERRRDQAIRTVLEHRQVVIGLGVLGVGIASAVTAGAASVGLAIGAACLPAANFPAFFGTGALDLNLAVTLESAAVALLLDMKDAGKQAHAVGAAIAKSSTGPNGRVTLSGEDIAAVASAAQPVPGVRIEPVRVGVRMGFTVISAGLLLLALTLIPQDVHGLIIRAASAILVVGVLIACNAVANGSWLKGR
jgi:hypothetical protein